MHRRRQGLGHLKRALAASALGAATLISTRARGEPTSSDTRAEALFNTAKQLQSTGQVADACPMFAESKELAPGVGVTLHLADCYERIGRTASAWQEFQVATTLARERGDEKRAAVAQDRARALEPKLERLTLATSGAAHEGWQLTLDGVTLAADRWNAAMALDPGDHTVVVSAPGQPPRTLRAHLDPANNAVTLHVDAGIVPEGATTPGVPSLPSAPPPPQSSTNDSWRAWAEVSLVGVTAAGVGFGSFFMIRRGHFIQEGTTNPSSLADQATTAATISFVASGVALTSALVLFFTTPSPQGRVGWTIAPTVFGTAAGAIVHASF